MDENALAPLPKQQRRRASWRQRLHLVDSLRANLDIVRATGQGHTANARVVEFWTQLTAELNSMSKKCARDVIEWQHVWNLWCQRLRSKCRRISASLQDINKDGAVSTDERLNDLEMKIFDVISRVDAGEVINRGFLNQSRAGKNKEKLSSHSTGCPLQSTDYGSIPYQIEEEETASSANSRKRTSMDSSTPLQNLKVECRICLQYVCCENQCFDIFNPWGEGSDTTIASYFTQVTNIQVTPSDRHTKYICFKCLGLLENCVQFIKKAQYSDTQLKKRYELPIEDPLWPKPIQIDKCISNDSKIEIEVKQEVLSDEDVSVMEMDNEELNMDIKVEPDEYASYDCSPQIIDTISITPIIEDENTNNSIISRNEDDNYLEELNIKEEPMSDSESDLTLDLPLDCMLCAKGFHSVSGLKAHVIAQHSYLTIARKTEVTPRIYQCFTCRRTFLTHTDLIVHETCHGDYACYMCNSKFETFMLLTKHRKRCRNNGDHVSRLKTLDDVKRHSPDLLHTKTADSTNTEPESPTTYDGNEADSTNTEDSQKIHHPKSGHLVDTELKSQELLHPKAGNSINTEIELQKVCQTKTFDSTEIKSQTIQHSEAEDSTNTESKPGDSTNTESKAANLNNTEQIHNAKPADSINFKIKEKIEDSTNTDQAVVPNSQSAAVVETICNSSQNSNSSKSNYLVTEENNAISEDNNLNSENNHNFANIINSELNNSNSVLDNSNSNTAITNCESTERNQDLETPIGDSHIQISTESEEFNLTLDSSTDIDEGLNSSVPETDVKKAISSDLSQRQSLNTNSTSPKLGAGSEVDSLTVNVNNKDHVSASEDNVTERSNLAMDSENVVTKSDHSVSKNSDLESVVEMNNIAQSQIGSANTSIEVSEHGIENTPVLAPESDSMKIHLAIHSLDKKCVDNLKIDEEIIETKESNEDKVLQ